MGANILMGAIILRFKFKTKTIKMNKNLKVVSYADPSQWLKPSFAPHPTFFLKRVVHALRNFLEVNDVDLEDVDVAHLVELDHQVLLLLSCLQALPGDQLTVTLISSHLSSIHHAEANTKFEEATKAYKCDSQHFHDQCHWQWEN